MEKMLVIAAGHGPVPMAENSRRYITDKPVLVPLTTYYRLRLLHGELKEAPAESVTPSPQTKAAMVASPDAPAMGTPVPLAKLGDVFKEGK